ncbi:MAG: SDR family oxidoreductase [Chloroflexi bacterium]|nr:SDR family oxidoreductase [Chloroflexota bacterium]
MKNIIITGSTRGIGFGLADAFLERNCQITLNGRSAESVHNAIAKLAANHGKDRIAGQHGDVTSYEDNELLWQTAVERFGKVDIWINNAGRGHPMMPVWELPPDTVRSVVEIDLLGLIYGSQVALKNMISQGHGQLFNMEGFGSDGRMRAGLSVYGSTKSAVRFLTESLVKEAASTPVQVGALSPGMVITEFITEQFVDDPQGLEEAKRIFNILGDRVETVTPWLADKVLACNKSGERYAWLSPAKIMMRFATSRFNKRDLFLIAE